MASNASNASTASNASNASNAGNAGDPGGWFIPERADLPFVTVIDNNGHEVGMDRRPNPGNFLDHRWGAQWYAWTVLTEVTLAIDIGVNPNRTWRDHTDVSMLAPGNAPPVGAARDAELDGLFNAARDERAAALGEILAQADDFITEFMALLSITAVSHPHTHRLMHIGSVVGAFGAMHYKQHFNRPRPSQIAPGLLPPIAMPGHSSFPSGHATQARLIANCLNHLFVTAGLAAADRQVMGDNLQVLSDRIARNREIAGLHYPSDTAAGVRLADDLFDVLNNNVAGLPAIGRFNATVNGAVAAGEW
jgi:PAP2 superfamily